jgi:hypothetical protein
VFSTLISTTLAQDHADDVREGVRRARSRHARHVAAPESDVLDVTIRIAQPADARALHTLAQLDSRDALNGYVLVAEVAGELRAALAVSDGTAIADPFRPTAAIVSLLALRARQLRAGEAQASRGGARRSLVAIPNR